jgi:hypothetical protein
VLLFWPRKRKHFTQIFRMVHAVEQFWCFFIIQMPDTFIVIILTSITYFFFNWCSLKFRTYFYVWWGNITPYLFNLTLAAYVICLMTILHILCLWMCLCMEKIWFFAMLMPGPLSVGHLTYLKLLCMPLCEKNRVNLCPCPEDLGLLKI